MDTNRRMSNFKPNKEALKVWAEAGEDPADLINWWVGNNPFYEDSECLIHTGYPKLVAWYNVDFVFDDFDTWKSSLKIEWLDDASTDEKEATITSAWNFLAIEEDYIF